MSDYKVQNNLTAKGDIESKRVYVAKRTTIDLLAGQTVVTINWDIEDVVVLRLENGANTVNVNFNGTKSKQNCRLVVVQHPTVKKEVVYSTNILNLDVCITPEIDGYVAYDYAIDADDNFVCLGGGAGTGSYVEDNDYSSQEVISTGDTYNVSLSKLDSILGKLIPDLPPLIGDVVLSVSSPTLYSCNRVVDGASVSGVAFSQPITITHSTQFYDTEQYSLVARIDGFAVGSLPLTDGDDSGTNGMLQILSNNAYDGFSDVLQARITLSGLIANRESRSIVLDINGDESNVLSIFYDELQTLLAPQSTVDTPLYNLTKVSGIPVLRSGDVLSVSSNIRTCVTYFYRSIIGLISGTDISNTNITSPSFAALTENDDISVTTNVSILSNKVDTDTTFVSYGVAPNGAHTPTESDIRLSNTRDILTDSISDITKFGYTHNVNLSDPLADTQLLLFGGVLSYPHTDWNGVESGNDLPATGLDYTNLTGDRYVEFPVSLVNKGTVELNLTSQIGFTNAAIEANTGYSLQMKLDSGAWLDANSAYDGVGEVLAGEGCLVVSNSTKAKKVLTFGVVTSGTATVRLTLNENSNHSFTQDTYLVAGEY